MHCRRKAAGGGLAYLAELVALGAELSLDSVELRLQLLLVPAPHTPAVVSN